MRARKSTTPRRPRVRTSVYDWDSIRAEYVTGALDRKEIVEKYGMASAGLDARASREDWVSQRVAFRREAAEQALAQAKIDIAERMESSIKAIYNIKVKVLQALRAKVGAPTYDPTVRDLEILQKLELELIGARERAPDGVNVNITFEARIESLMSRVQSERDEAIKAAQDESRTIDVPATVSETMATPGPSADFMFGDLDNDDEEDV